MHEKLGKIFADAKKNAVHERTKKFIKKVEILKKEIDLLEVRDVLEQ
nr:hypothetical protein [uncultured Treponema sp.]